MKLVFLLVSMINYMSSVRVESATPAPSVNNMKNIVPSTIVCSTIMPSTIVCSVYTDNYTNQNMS